MKNKTALFVHQICKKITRFGGKLQFELNKDSQTLMLWLCKKKMIAYTSQSIFPIMENNKKALISTPSIPFFRFYYSYIFIEKEKFEMLFLLFFVF
jgi:hypothetical protein